MRSETFRKGTHRVIIQITQDAAGKDGYLCSHQISERTPFTIPLTPEQYSSTVFWLLTRGYAAVW